MRPFEATLTKSGDETQDATVGQTDGRTDGPAARAAPTGPRGAPAPPREPGRRLPGPRGAAHVRSAELSPGGSHCKRVAPQAGQQRSAAGPRGSPATGTPPHGPTPYLSPGHATRASHDLWLASSARSQEGPPPNPCTYRWQKGDCPTPPEPPADGGGRGPCRTAEPSSAHGPCTGPSGTCLVLLKPHGHQEGSEVQTHDKA